MKRIAILTLIAALCGCTNADRATRALEGAGYKGIQITGYRVFGCSDDDEFHAGFQATGPSGQQVTGVVCSGLFKGATIRTD